MSVAITQGKVYSPLITVSLELPLALTKIPAGFPSPAEDYAENSLDITQYLVKRPKTTFFMRVVGDSMEGLGIRENSLLVIDRAAPVYDRCVVIARIGDEFCCKQLRYKDGGKWLYSANENYKPIPLDESMDVEIWGRVLHAVNSFTSKL